MGASQVIAGGPLTGTGGVLAGPLGTALPTDETTALDDALKAQGYVGDDGLTMKIDRKTEKIRAWGGDTVKVIQTEHSVEFELDFLETNTEVLKQFFGSSNVTTTAATASSGTKNKVTLNAATLPPQVYVFEMKDGNARIRVVLPNAQITENSDVKFTSKDAIGYGVKLEALPDALGNKAYIYSNDGLTV